MTVLIAVANKYKEIKGKKTLVATVTDNQIKLNYHREYISHSCHKKKKMRNILKAS